jgi:hypothetical protein
MNIYIYKVFGARRSYLIFADDEPEAFAYMSKQIEDECNYCMNPKKALKWDLDHLNIKVKSEVKKGIFKIMYEDG